MYLLSLIFSITAALAAGAPQSRQLPSNATHLHVSTLVGVNGSSALECWSVAPPFTIGTQPGIVGARIQSLGDSENSSLVFFSDKNATDAGLHAAPAPQWVTVLQGSGVITLPDFPDVSLPLSTGSLIIAADTQDVSEKGHGTVWSKATVAAQLPFANGTVPEHSVVNKGPCKSEGGN